MSHANNLKIQKKYKISMNLIHLGVKIIHQIDERRVVDLISKKVYLALNTRKVISL